MLPNMLQLHQESSATGRKNAKQSLSTWDMLHKKATTFKDPRGHSHSTATCCHLFTDSTDSTGDIRRLVLICLDRAWTRQENGMGALQAENDARAASSWPSCAAAWSSVAPAGVLAEGLQGAWHALMGPRHPKLDRQRHEAQDQAELVHLTKPLRHKNHQNSSKSRRMKVQHVQSPSFCKHLLAATPNIERLEGVHCSMTSGESNTTWLVQHANEHFYAFLTTSPWARKR